MIVALRTFNCVLYGLNKTVVEWSKMHYYHKKMLRPPHERGAVPLQVLQSFFDTGKHGEVVFVALQVIHLWYKYQLVSHQIFRIIIDVDIVEGGKAGCHTDQSLRFHLNYRGKVQS